MYMSVAPIIIFYSFQLFMIKMKIIMIYGTKSAINYPFPYCKSSELWEITSVIVKVIQ